MHVNKNHCGLTFKHPRVSREHQESELRKAGASWLVHIGKDCASWRQVVDQLERGDVVYIYSGPMVPQPRRKAGAPLQPQWTEFIGDVHLRGAFLIEVSTGRRSNVRKEFLSMNRETHALLRQGGKRLPKSVLAKGRKPTPWPSLEVENEWRRRWKSKNYRSDAAVIREAKEAGFTEQAMCIRISTEFI